MIGILIIAHDTLPESLAQAATHVLGSRPPQFDVLPVTCDDDPLDAAAAREAAIARLDTGEGVVVFSDIYGATPCNLVGKLIESGPCRGRGRRQPSDARPCVDVSDGGMDTMVRKAVSGGCEGVLHSRSTRGMQQREVEIVNKLGPACARCCETHPAGCEISSEVCIARNGRKVNAKSIMGVMMLAAGKGSKVTLDTDGADESEAMEAIAALIANYFGEGA